MKAILRHIYEEIIELSDLNLQRKLWLNQNNDTGLISSYVELMNSLFGDYCFNDFVDKSSLEMGLSEAVTLDLKKLRDLLNNYNEKRSDKEIIDDPEWKKIVDQAQKVIERWDEK